MSFNYVEYLKRHMMVGQIDPWRVDDEGEKLYALLVPIENAMDECKAWSGEDLTRKMFIQRLKDGNVFVFRNVDEFAKVKEELKKEEPKPEKKFKKQISEERRKQLRNQMNSINEKKQPTN